MDQPTRLIELDRFSYSIGARDILRDISLTIAPGEYVCLLGPNGAGKSTLIKCLTRIWRGRNGGIQINGQPLEQIRQTDLARQVAYVPQSDGRSAPFTVYEFVMMGRYPYLTPFGSLTDCDHAAVRSSLDITDTAQFAQRQFDTLSGGEAQKVLLAAALAQQASALLLDEPTTFLDPRHQVEINRMLERVNREDGVAVVCATHDVNTAVSSSQRIIGLRDGQVLFDGPPEELIQTGKLNELYDHAFVTTEHPSTGRPVILPDPCGDRT